MWVEAVLSKDDLAASLLSGEKRPMSRTASDESPSVVLPGRHVPTVPYVSDIWSLLILLPHA